MMTVLMLLPLLLAHLGEDLVGRLVQDGHFLELLALGDGDALHLRDRRDSTSSTGSTGNL